MSKNSSIFAPHLAHKEKNMMEPSNGDTYNFISEELTYYPELPQYSAEELAAHKGDKEFWAELEEKLDCFRMCDVCGEPMLEGFIIYGGEAHYCSEECRRRIISDKEYKRQYNEWDSDTFWTTWWDNSIRYSKQVG